MTAGNKPPLSPNCLAQGTYVDIHLVCYSCSFCSTSAPAMCNICERADGSMIFLELSVMYKDSEHLSLTSQTSINILSCAKHGMQATPVRFVCVGGKGAELSWKTSSCAGDARFQEIDFSKRSLVCGHLFKK